MFVITVNNKLLVDLLYVSIIASIIASQAIQKVKETFKLNSTFNNVLSIIMSFSIGFSYALTFYTTNLVYAIWIGIFTLIEARSLYKTFKGFFGLESISKENKKDN